MMKVLIVVDHLLLTWMSEIFVATEFFDKYFRERRRYHQNKTILTKNKMAIAQALFFSPFMYSSVPQHGSAANLHKLILPFFELSPKL